MAEAEYKVVSRREFGGSMVVLMYENINVWYRHSM